MFAEGRDYQVRQQGGKQHVTLAAAVAAAAAAAAAVVAADVPASELPFEPLPFAAACVCFWSTVKCPFFVWVALD